MKNKSVYESCRRLALRGSVHTRSGVYTNAVYVDSFGCDLYVYYSSSSNKETGDWHESVIVYFGGREVYSFDNNEAISYTVEGYWKELISQLRQYEIAISIGDSYAVNGTLIELCKRESARNRKAVKKYCEICSNLAIRDGELVRVNEKRRNYNLQKIVDGHKIEVDLIKRTPVAGGLYWDDVRLFFDRKSKFWFSWNCSAAGSLLDDKGRYIPGEWEQILERMVDES